MSLESCHEEDAALFFKQHYTYWKQKIYLQQMCRLPLIRSAVHPCSADCMELEASTSSCLSCLSGSARWRWRQTELQCWDLASSYSPQAAVKTSLINIESHLAPDLLEGWHFKITKLPMLLWDDNGNEEYKYLLFCFEIWTGHFEQLMQATSRPNGGSTRKKWQSLLHRLIPNIDRPLTVHWTQY